MTVRIAFLGDTLLGGEAQATLDEHGYAYALDGLRPLLADADLVVANHEGPLTRRAQPQAKSDTGRKRYWYRADPASAVALADAGIGLVSLANNHVCDYGPEGLHDTLTALDAAGIAHCGAGPDLPAATRPAILDIGPLRIGFLSAMQRYRLYDQERLYATETRSGPARLRLTRIRQDITALREHVDICVVLVHWGRNYQNVSPRQERLARGMQEAGADLIIGHHPHIPQRVETIGTTPVLYSLGNGALGTPGRYHSGRPPYGIIALADLEHHRIPQLKLRLLHIDNTHVHYQPRPVTGTHEQALLQSLTRPTGHATPKIYL